MNAILVGYDLNKQGQNYPKIIEALKAYGTWFHSLDSTWIIKTTESASQVMAKLEKLVDANDELLVIDITGDFATWTGFDQKSSDWLKTQLST